MQLTNQFFDTLVVAVIVIGAALAVVRLYRDFSRPIVPHRAQDESSIMREALAVVRLYGDDMPSSSPTPLQSDQPTSMERTDHD